MNEKIIGLGCKKNYKIYCLEHKVLMNYFNELFSRLSSTVIVTPLDLMFLPLRMGSQRNVSRSKKELKSASS